VPGETASRPSARSEEPRIADARTYFGKLIGCGFKQVEMARALLRHDGLGAANVKAGKPLQPIYEEY